MYISTSQIFKSVFELNINRNPLLLFNYDRLDAVFYRFEGDKLTYLQEKIKSLTSPKLESIAKNTISFQLGKDSFIKIMYNKETSNTGMCLYNNKYNLGQLKSVSEKKEELADIMNKFPYC